MTDKARARTARRTLLAALAAVPAERRQHDLLLPEIRGEQDRQGASQNYKSC